MFCLTWKSEGVVGGSGEIMMKEEINVAKVEVIVYSWCYISVILIWPT